MLELRPSCEHCNKALPPNSTEAMICTFECTFCKGCVESVLENACPNIPLRAHFVADAKLYADAKPEPYESTNVSVYIATSLDGFIASRSLDTHHFSVCRGMGVFTFFTYFLKLAVLKCVRMTHNTQQREHDYAGTREPVI